MSISKVIATTDHRSDGRPVAGTLPMLDEEVGDRRRIKVLVITPTLWVGGHETSLVRTLPLIDRGRFEIRVCTYHDRGPLTQQLMDAGIHIIGPFPDSSGPVFLLARNVGRWLNRLFARWTNTLRVEAWLKWLIQRLASALALVLLRSPMVETIAQYIRENKIDVVHAIQEHSYIYGGLASQLNGRIPVIFCRGSLREREPSVSLLNLLERYVLHPRVNLAICNSEKIAQELETEGIPRSKIRVVYNGLDTNGYSRALFDRATAREQLGIAQNSLVFSSVATLRKIKGHADLLQALHKISKELPRDWLVLVVGRDADGNLPELKELCNQLDLASHVQFLGERIDVPTILSSADIHVSASHTEGFPNNVLEAMCSRLPVVATAVGGVPELVVHGLTGLLVKARDPHALGDAILALANDSECRARMGSAGYHRAKTNFSIQRRVAAFEEIYERVVGSAATEQSAVPR